MKSFVCFKHPENEAYWSCAMQIGQLYVFPIFNHGGYNSTYPSYCECDDEEWRHSAECNAFSFLSGFLFYDFNSTETDSDSLRRLLELVFESQMSGGAINRKAFDISFDISNSRSVTRGDQAWKDEHFDFCRSSDGKYCSLLTIYKFSYVNSVTNFHFPVYHGSCNDFVSLSEEAAERFINTPPTELVEPYLKCRSTVASALFDTLGIVSGNISALTPVLMLVIFYLYFYLFITWKGVKQEVTYSQLELDAITKFLTFNLALTRDGLHPTQLRAEAAAASGTPTGQRDSEAILEDSVLLRLLRELKQEEVSYDYCGRDSHDCVCSSPLYVCSMTHVMWG